MGPHKLIYIFQKEYFHQLASWSSGMIPALGCIAQTCRRPRVRITVEPKNIFCPFFESAGEDESPVVGWRAVEKEERAAVVSSGSLQLVGGVNMS